MATAHLEDAIRVLGASAAALPTIDDMGEMITNSKAAQARGYYDPVEDERLREHYARYLGIRTALWEMILSLKPYISTKQRSASPMSETETRAFAIAFCAADLLVRSGDYLIGLARERELIWKKLDEAEARYGIPRKSFTRIYRSLTSKRTMNWFYKAREYYRANEGAIKAALNDEALRPVLQILDNLGGPAASREQHGKRYARFVHFSLRRRRLSAGRNIMFALFEMTGSDIAELKIPLVKAPEATKRVTQDVIDNVLPMLRPGDVFITRHDDAMSNLFLPGFWPHGALYIGSPEQRSQLGVEDVSDGFRHSGDDIHFLESKKDGVLLRPMTETLQVDAFVVLRPKLEDADMRAALSRALSHAGKLYDFIFDFSTADRLVCTEVIYRAFHGIGPIRFDLSQRAGRSCLSAEDFLNQGLSSAQFEMVAAYGLEGNELVTAEEAKRRLVRSFESEF